MDTGDGNLGRNERLLSLGASALLATFAARGGSSFVRMLSGIGAAGFLSRAIAGHCAMKAAMTGKSTLREGFSQQWRHMASQARRKSEGTEWQDTELDPAISEKPVRERTQHRDDGPGWMSHQNGRVTGTGTVPGTGDSEAGTTAVR